MQAAALQHVVRIDHRSKDRPLELEISFSTLVSHTISGRSGVQNEGGVLFARSVLRL